jgi:uridine phosphorylase
MLRTAQLDIKHWGKQRTKQMTLQYHLQLNEGDVGRYVLLPGDPARCARIAEYFDEPQFIAQNREYTTFSGYLNGEKVSVTSTGIGCPSTAIAVEELIKIGADTFIRVGTSGGIQPGTQTGDIAIVTGAIRDEGTTRQYLPIEFPALADPEIVLALQQSALGLGFPFRVGVTHSKDSFYGEVEPDRQPLSSQLTQRWQAWRAGGAICSEMEASALFILASLHSKRAGGVMTMVAENEGLPTDQEGEKLFHGDRAIRTAIDGVKRLIEKDQQTATG